MSIIDFLCKAYVRHYIMATYPQITEYIKRKHGFTVNPCWISDVKDICGLPRRKTPNLKTHETRKHPCPQKKVDVIKQAFKHFDMI